MPPQVYEAMAYHVSQANFNRRIKAVSVWSLQMTAQAVLNALRAMMNPMTASIQEKGSPYELVIPSGTISSEATS